MSKLVVNEIISVDASPVDFPDGITINGANLDVGAGGGGGAVKTILLRDDGAGGSTWQHLISSSDLTGGDDFIFILGSSSVADLNVVCIPTEASVPELANISELKLVVYGGTGKSGFSENFNGVGTGAQVLGTEGVAGSGCVIARKVGLDTWYLSYEVTKPSGPEVLKDWSVSPLETTYQDLLLGVSLGGSVNNVIIDFNVSGSSGNLELQLLGGSSHSGNAIATTGRNVGSGAGGNFNTIVDTNYSYFYGPTFKDYLVDGTIELYETKSGSIKSMGAVIKLNAVSRDGTNTLKRSMVSTTTVISNMASGTLYDTKAEIKTQSAGSNLHYRIRRKYPIV